MKLQQILTEMHDAHVEFEFKYYDDDEDRDVTLYVSANVDFMKDMYGTGDSPDGYEVFDINIETDDGRPVYIENLPSTFRRKIEDRIRDEAYGY